MFLGNFTSFTFFLPKFFQTKNLLLNIAKETSYIVGKTHQKNDIGIICNKKI